MLARHANMVVFRNVFLAMGERTRHEQQLSDMFGECLRIAVLGKHARAEVTLVVTFNTEVIGAPWPTSLSVAWRETSNSLIHRE